MSEEKDGTVSQDENMIMPVAGLSHRAGKTYGDGFSAEEIVELYKEGKTVKEVEKKTGVSHKTIKKMLGEAGVDMRNAVRTFDEKIDVLRSCGIDGSLVTELFEEAGLSRTKLVSAINDRVNDNLFNRKNIVELLNFYSIDETALKDELEKRKQEQTQNDKGTTKKRISAVVESLKNEGITREVLVSRYIEENMSKSSLLEWLSPKTNEKITLKTLTNVLKELDIKKPRELVNEQLRKKKVISSENVLPKKRVKLEDVAVSVNNKLHEDGVFQRSIKNYYWHHSISELAKWLSEKTGMSVSYRVADRILNLNAIDKSNKYMLAYRNTERSFFLLSQWNYDLNKNVSPENVSVSSKDAFWWECDFGHTWQASVHNRYSLNADCHVCSGFKVLKGSNDLETLRPDLLKEWDYAKNESVIAPSEVAVASSIKVGWVCKFGHEWDAKVCNRTKVNNPTQCPFCTHQMVLTGFNDLSTVSPEIAAEWHLTKNAKSASEVSAKTNKKSWWFGKDCGHEWEQSIYDRVVRKYSCSECSKLGVSKMERELFNFVEGISQDKGYTVICNDRSVIAPKELDIYIPKLNIAFEFNGLYWHSEEAGKDKTYHYDKWERCAERGIQLITIWEDDWRDKKDVMKKIIAHKLGASSVEKVGARKTYVDPTVSFKDASLLLNENHIQGEAGGTVYAGLRMKSNDDLVAAMVLQEFKPSVFTIMRYATDRIVQGGFTKLLNYVENEIDELSELVTFSDNDISDGALYANNGFEKVTELKPDYKYVQDKTRKHKFLFRKERFKNNPQLLFEEGLTERELAELNGLLRIYDSGKVKWRKTYQK